MSLTLRYILILLTCGQIALKGWFGMNWYVVEVFDGSGKIGEHRFQNVRVMREACKNFWGEGWQFKVSQIIPVDFCWVEEWEGNK